MNNFCCQHAIDLSEGMLARAEAKGIYDVTRQMTLGQALDFPDDFFNLSQSMGVFTAGHAPASAFDELTRVVRPGGHIVFSLMEAIREEQGYAAKFSELERAQRWRLAECTAPFVGLPLAHPDSLYRVHVYQVT